jgi:menaquinone-dependent protoporphyrinogen oxidase
MSARRWGETVNAMKVLVAHASKRGSTAEIAEAVAGALRQSGLEVECVPAAEVKSLSGFDAVVLGSAVYMKRWRGDAKHFLRKHRDALGGMPFWVFSSGPVGDPAEDDPKWMEPPRIVGQVERLGGRGHVVFGGRLPLEPHGPIEKAMVEGIPREFHDRRDWDGIRAWATAVAAEVQSGAALRQSA